PSRNVSRLLDGGIAAPAGSETVYAQEEGSGAAVVEVENESFVASTELGVVALDDSSEALRGATAGEEAATAGGGLATEIVVSSRAYSYQWALLACMNQFSGEEEMETDLCSL